MIKHKIILVAAASFAICGCSRSLVNSELGMVGKDNISKEVSEAISETEALSATENEDETTVEEILTTENEQETTAETMALETNEAGYEMRKWDPLYDENGEAEVGVNCLTLFKIDGVVYSGLLMSCDIDDIFGVTEIGAMSMIDRSLVPKYDMEFAVGSSDLDLVNSDYFPFKNGDIVYWGYRINPEGQKEKVVAKKYVIHGEEGWQFLSCLSEYTQ